MNRLRIDSGSTPADTDWSPFPGGELEGPRPRALCTACRARVLDEGRAATPPSRPACFQCYRLQLQRDRKLAAAGGLDTASETRFQHQLPFEPVNVSRLAQLKTEREQLKAKHVARPGGSLSLRRRQAQIEARHALARVFRGLRERQAATPQERRMTRISADAALRAAELQLPESWLPFVVSQ